MKILTELKITASRENLAKVFDFMQTNLNTCNIPKKIMRQIKLCIEEIYMNIVNYAYNPKIGEARMNLQINKNDKLIKIIIKFEDEGIPYDPTKKPDPNTNLERVEDAPIGGLGIYLVKNIIDNIKYERKNNTNILIIEKNVEPERK